MIKIKLICQIISKREELTIFSELAFCYPTQIKMHFLEMVIVKMQLNSIQIAHTYSFNYKP